MRKNQLFVLAFGILFLFFIQMAGTLVQSIYVLDLMKTSLDAKALGVLFFFSPVLLLLFRRKLPRHLTWALVGVLFLARGVTPSLDTFGRLLTAGVGTGVSLLLFMLLVGAKPKGESQAGSGAWISAGLALGVILSVLLRSLKFGIDYSLTPSGAWTGWGLGLIFGLLITQVEWTVEPSSRRSQRGLNGALVGIFLVLALVYFAFSAPAVIARWTEGNYVMIVITVSILAAGWAWDAVARPHLLDRLTPAMLLTWNLAFSLCLVGTILAQRVAFPPTPGSPAVVVGNPHWLGELLLYMMLLLFPVIFYDMALFVNRVRQVDPAPRDLVPGMLMGSAALVVLIFITIFTNVWGYIAPVSTLFRNMFWLPFLLISTGISLLALGKNKLELDSTPESTGRNLSWLALLGVIYLACTAGALRSGQLQTADLNKTSLLVMTYNIQAGNDGFAESSFDRQLEIIRQVSPDIVALQETDTARISLNNNDIVRYFAGRLGYHSYYGPTTVSGTFGTAILSRYPLLNTRTAFTYSDQDEIGTAEAEIEVGGRRFTIYDVHPDGSDAAKMAFARSLLERSREQPYVIAMGDYNLRDYEAAYQLIAGQYTNAWVSVYPSKVGNDGTDMSGDNRIDHIFVSRSLGVRNPVYVLPPASATDHPVHWAEIFWEK